MRRRTIQKLRFTRARALEKYQEALAKHGAHHTITKYLKKQYDNFDEQYHHSF